jgi:hypothetical protein
MNIGLVLFQEREEKMKDRYGVVNVIIRTSYEKEYQVPYGYDLICYDREEAITECKKFNESEGTNNYIVERIYDDGYACNNKEEIFRINEIEESEGFIFYEKNN